MKVKFIFLTVFFLFSALATQAQFNDTILFKKADFVGDVGKFLDARQGLQLDKSSTKLIKLTPVQAKKMRVPAPTKSSKGPIILKFGDSCYQFSCQKSEGCDNCRMFWWDRNKDGKVQPRRELRCACPDTRSQCKVRVRKVACR